MYIFINFVLKSGLVAINARDDNVYFHIAPFTVRVKNGEKTVITEAFLDSGSTSSFITFNLINQFEFVSIPVIDIITQTIQ